MYCSFMFLNTVVGISIIDISIVILAWVSFCCCTPPLANDHRILFVYIVIACDATCHSLYTLYLVFSNLFGQSAEPVHVEAWEDFSAGLLQLHGTD